MCQGVFFYYFLLVSRASFSHYFRVCLLLKMSVRFFSLETILNFLSLGVMHILMDTGPQLTVSLKALCCFLLIFMASDEKSAAYFLFSL